MRKKEINSEVSMMDGFRQGHHTAFMEVFNLLYSSLCYYSFKITTDQAAAEDIVEDSFIKIWERREMFFEMNVLKSYLYATIRNASFNWLKKEKQAQALKENIKINLTPEENAAFKNMLGAEIFSRLTVAMQNLPPQGMQVIKMIFFEGKNTRTAAEELGVSQSTVKTQKRRSLLKLKQIIRQ